MGFNAPNIAGIWHVANEAIFEGGDDTVEGTAAYLDLRDDGSGTLHSNEPTTGIAYCQPVNYLLLDDALVIDVNAWVQVVRFVKIDDNKLTFAAYDGVSSLLTRVAEVPVASRCGSLRTSAQFENLADTPSYATGLAFDGTYVWYTDENDRAVSVDPGSGVRASYIQLSSSAYIHAAFAATFWADCNCGGDEITQWTRQGQKVDTVAIEDDFGGEPDAIAVDPDSGLLYVAAYKRSASTEVLLRINAGGEPDVLVSEVPFTYVNAMSFDSGVLWVLRYDGQIAAVDPLSGKALRTYQSLDRRVEWRGIAVDGNSIYLLAVEEGDRGVLIDARIATEP